MAGENPAESRDDVERADSERADENETAGTRERLLSLDTYRGLIMVSLAFNGFGLASTASNYLESDSGSSFWESVRYQFSHVQWLGCSYWDLIQPSFMFMVGLSMAYSYAKRQGRGHSYPRMLAHAVTRSIVLILLSVVLMSQWREHTNWTLMNVLAQIGLGYTFLFLLWNRSVRTQALAAGLILAGTWIAYEVYPDAGVDLATGAPELGVSAEWAQEHLAGVRDPWHKNANIGHAVDLWLLNRFPRPEPFVYNTGGYQTINFVPSLVTMLFGLMAGGLLLSGRSPRRKALILAIGGALGLIVGGLLHVTGACPLVKRIWTPSWTLFSTGWCLLILAGLFTLIDLRGFRRWTFPFVVVGMNSIAIYCMSMTLKPWTASQLQAHLGKGVFESILGPAFEPTVRAVMVGLCFWLICYYLYRQRVFLRI